MKKPILIAKVYSVDDGWCVIIFHIKNSNYENQKFILGTISPHCSEVDFIIENLKGWEIEDHRDD